MIRRVPSRVLLVVAVVCAVVVLVASVSGWTSGLGWWVGVVGALAGTGCLGVVASRVG